MQIAPPGPLIVVYFITEKGRTTGDILPDFWDKHQFC